MYFKNISKKLHGVGGKQSCLINICSSVKEKHTENCHLLSCQVLVRFQCLVHDLSNVGIMVSLRKVSHFLRVEALCI